jgi:hypothetical protein
MANQQASVVHHLLERGLITYESAVDGDLMLIGGASNHKNSKVIRQKSPSFFIKQIQRWDEMAMTTLRREAECYRAGHDDEDFAALKPLLPKYYDFDPARHTLVIELLSTGESLAEYCLRTSTYPAGVASKLGGSLAACHMSAGRAMQKENGGAALSKVMPWILMIHRQPPETTNFNSHSQQLLAFMKSDGRVVTALDTLQAQWRTNNFIHGDLKWDNYIITPNEAEGAEHDLKIVDWELGGFGDADWDVGSVFQSFLSFPLVTMQAFTRELPSDLRGLMQYSSADTLAAIRDFWIAYVTVTQMNETAAGECIARSMQHCAARMMQTGFEMTEVLKGPMDKYYSDMLTAKAYCLVRVAMSIFHDPSQSMGLLFNLQP